MARSAWTKFKFQRELNQMAKVSFAKWMNRGLANKRMQSDSNWLPFAIQVTSLVFPFSPASPVSKCFIQLTKIHSTPLHSLNLSQRLFKITLYFTNCSRFLFSINFFMDVYVKLSRGIEFTRIFFAYSCSQIQKTCKKNMIIF